MDLVNLLMKSRIENVVFDDAINCSHNNDIEIEEADLFLNWCDRAFEKERAKEEIS